MKIPNIWLISDLHLGHYNILKFKRDDGTPLRPEFDDLWQMFGCIQEHWHETVKTGDKVYVLGDVALGELGKQQLLMMNTWPGQKRLVRGNHDLYDDKVYHDAGFKHIYGVRQVNGVWFTHVPMHPGSLSGRARGNVHGHLHAGEVTIRECPQWGGALEREADDRYFNVSVERTGYRPIHLEEIIHLTKWDTKGMME